jgi:DNA helicase II / ATP-dependent DNA helicase PcrA
LPEAVEHVIERSGLIAHYRTEKEGQDRVDNLRELVNAAAAFLSEQGVAQDVPANLGVAAVAAPVSGDAIGAGDEILPATGGDAPVLDADALPQATPLAGFLAHASLESGDNQAGEGTDAVQLMTVHSAKGLEFDAVFITGLEEGLFPHENSVTELDGLDEERRLMYVAITRARRRLYLSFSQTRMLHGQTRYNVRSRFLEELPEGSLKWLTPQGGRGVTGGFERRGGRGDEPPPWGTPADARLAARFDRGISWRVGQGVAHARFGEGVIIDIEGSGSDARVQVNFGREGVKWLALSVAKLEPAG